MIPIFARRRALALAALLLPAAALAQTGAAPAPTPAAPQWYLLDPQLDKTPGVSATRTYAELLKNRTPTPIVVAVIDSGIDTAHADLKSVLWKNPREIPGNGLDDDKNGYVDDVHGWNFLGGADGRNVGNETLELTRLVAKGQVRFKDKTRAQVKASERADYDEYQKVLKKYQEKLEEAQGQAKQVDRMGGPLQSMVSLLKKELGTERLDTATLRQAKPTDPNVRRMSQAMYKNLKMMGAADTDEMLKEFNDATQHVSDEVAYNLNLSYNPRADIIKDDPENVNDRKYGNPDITGPDALHGTHVAGIIAADRLNNLGVEGIAGPVVRLMGVRAVPNGDERDKDVANAIRYAVDNGASIINMSFGKEYSPQRPAVDAAFRYAAEHNVLLVHAAGNEDDDLETTAHYPAAAYLNGKPVPTLLTVGASGPSDDEALAADFSNYGRRSVDVFAPGVNIYSTLPGSRYGNESGTSMAAPVTAGVAAVLRSYFPRLSAADVKRIIQQSAVVHHTTVRQPGTNKKVDFATLSATGGVVNLYQAVQLALQEEAKQ